MDELLFRISRSFESLQVQILLASERSKSFVLTNSELIYQNILNIWNNERITQYKDYIDEIRLQVLEILQRCKLTVLDLFCSPAASLAEIVHLLRTKSSIIDKYSFACGLLLGLCIGMIIGFSLQRKSLIIKQMKAVVCNGYNGIDRIAYVDDAIAPIISHTDDVLVEVKSACIDKIDFDICNGYGHFIRKYLAKYYDHKKSIFPIILGRSCSGIVIDIGCCVTKVEIGDEVWVTSPPYCPGTISEYVLTKEYFVGKKSAKISFEGAASLSYSGCVALECLEQIGLNETNALNKKILIENCCTPIGCVLTQILKLWGAIVTTTSTVRAADIAKAMGSTDNILCTSKDSIVHFDQEQLEENVILKELELRNTIFEIVIITNNEKMNPLNFKRFLNERTGLVINTLPKKYFSDNFHYVFGFIICFMLRIQHFFQKQFTKQHNEEKWLDMLRDLVENNQLQGVVDHIYPPQNIEMAVAHKLSPIAIGSTVLKFNNN